ncbi:hypothetical protein V1478_010568 [Vespula squamosa]|uniref:Uncharacterized protein n=1 Tax=Vespula squamosa TaxID=30214 RepID=A0ABD2AI47_VESSQ
MYPGINFNDLPYRERRERERFKSPYCYCYYYGSDGKFNPCLNGPRKQFARDAGYIALQFESVGCG